MKRLSLISYNLSKSNLSQKTAIQRNLNGYKDHSNNQEYRYKRKGLLEEIPCKNVNRGVILVEYKHKDLVLSVLKKNKASITVINLYSKTSVLH